MLAVVQKKRKAKDFSHTTLSSRRQHSSIFSLNTRKYSHSLSRVHGQLLMNSKARQFQILSEIPAETADPIPVSVSKVEKNRFQC